MLGTGCHAAAVERLAEVIPETMGSLSLRKDPWKDCGNWPKVKQKALNILSPVEEGNKCDNKAAPCHPCPVWEGSMRKTFM